MFHARKAALGATSGFHCVTPPKTRENLAKGKYVGCVLIGASGEEGGGPPKSSQTVSGKSNAGLPGEDAPLATKSSESDLSVCRVFQAWLSGGGNAILSGSERPASGNAAVTCRGYHWIKLLKAEEAILALEPTAVVQCTTAERCVTAVAVLFS